MIDEQAKQEFQESLNELKEALGSTRAYAVIIRVLDCMEKVLDHITDKMQITRRKIGEKFKSTL